MKDRINTYLHANPFILNAFGLMLSSGATALFGFIFWVIVAHLFRSSTVGMATTLLSISSLLSLLGLAGFDTVFVRFLAKSKRQNDHVNSGMVIAGVMSGLLAGLFVAAVPLIAPKLHVVDGSLWSVTAFVIFTVFTTWNTLTNAVLVAYRRTSFILAINIVFSVIKLVLPLFLRADNAVLIFTVAGIAQVVNVVLSLAVLMRFFSYRPSPKIHFDIVRETLHYGVTVYFSNIFNLLPASVLPIIVIDELGASAAAYFYIAFSLANLLYTVAYTTNQVLLAEVSHDEERFSQHARKGLALTFGLITPAIVATMVLAMPLLGLFGHSYSVGATAILRIMSLGGLAVVIYSFLNFVSRQKKNVRAMLFMPATNALLIIVLSLILARQYSLVGIGWAWVLGTLGASVVGLACMLPIKRLHVAPGTPRQIVISHFYSSENKGDAALLSVLMADIRRTFTQTSMTVLATDKVLPTDEFDGSPMQSSFMYYTMDRFTNPYLTLLYAFGMIATTLLWAAVYRLTGLSLPLPARYRHLCQLYADADLILPVGGGYLRGQHKGIGSLLYVVLVLHPIALSYILRKPTVLYTQSIGPFSNVLEEYIVRLVFNICAEAIIAREDASYRLMERIGVARHKIFRSVDSGFALTSSDRLYELRKRFKVDKGTLLVGVTAKKYFRGDAQTAYEKALAETARYIVNTYDAVVIFVPQVTAALHGDDDRVVHQRILDHIGATGNVYSLTDTLSHRDIKAVYDELDLVIGTRFHSVIFSLTSYVPAIAIEYEHKTSGIMHDLGLDDWVIKIEDVTKDSLVTYVDRLVKGRVSYRRKLRAIMPAYVQGTANAITIVADAYQAYSISHSEAVSAHHEPAYAD